MRKHDIDNLRSLCILLLIPYHAAQAWNTWGEPNYIFFEGNRCISNLIVFFSPYFMPMLFLMSGISTYYALQKQSIKQYVMGRYKRLLVPLISGTILLMPILTYLADIYNCGYQGSFLDHYRIFFTKFTDLIGADGGFSFGQFWFILYLFLISMAAAVVISIQKKKTPLQNLHIPLWGFCLLGLPLPLLNTLLSIGGKSFAEYTYFFLLGYFIFSNQTVAEAVKRHMWLFLLIGLTASAVNVYLFLWSETPYPILNTAAMYFAKWFMLLGLLGVGRRFLNSSNSLSRYLAQRSYALYYWHFLWVVLFQYGMSDNLLGHTLLLYLIPVLLSYGASALCCELTVRIPFLCFLTGVKKVQPKH